MTNAIEKIAMFAIGAVAGSFATWEIVKRKYELVENGEITVYPAEEKAEDTCDEAVVDDDKEPEFSEEDKNKAEEMIKDLKYRQYSNGKKKRKKSDPEDDDESVPYVISPDDVGETGYVTVNLTLYSDGILAYDDNDNVIENVELLIGNYALDRIGEYEPDIIHVRNDEQHADYEICQVNDRYYDMVSDDASEG